MTPCAGVGEERDAPDEEVATRAVAQVGPRGLRRGGPGRGGVLPGPRRAWPHDRRRGRGDVVGVGSAPALGTTGGRPVWSSGPRRVGGRSVPRSVGGLFAAAGREAGRRDRGAADGRQGGCHGPRRRERRRRWRKRRPGARAGAGGWLGSARRGKRWGQAERLVDESRPKPKTQGEASGVRRPASGVRRPASGVRRPASGVRRPASGVRRPASGVRRPANIIAAHSHGYSGALTRARQALARARFARTPGEVWSLQRHHAQCVCRGVHSRSNLPSGRSLDGTKHRTSPTDAQEDPTFCFLSAACPGMSDAPAPLPAPKTVPYGGTCLNKSRTESVSRWGTLQSSP